MDNCEYYAELISAMIDGEVSENEKAEIEAHISECAECRKMFEVFTAVSNSLEELEDVPAELHENIMREVKVAAKKKKPAWAKVLPLAACLAVVIFGGVKLFNVPASDSDKAEFANVDMCVDGMITRSADSSEYAEIIFGINGAACVKDAQSAYDVTDSAEYAESVTLVPGYLRDLLAPAEDAQYGVRNNANADMSLYCTVIFHGENGDEEVQIFIDGDAAYADFGEGPVLVTGTAQEIIDALK